MKKHNDSSGLETEKKKNSDAFTKAQQQGVFKHLPDGTYVAIVNGDLAGCDSDKDSLIQRIRLKGVKNAIFYKRVNIIERILHFRSPRK